VLLQQRCTELGEAGRGILERRENLLPLGDREAEDPCVVLERASKPVASSGSSSSWSAIHCTRSRRTGMPASVMLVGGR
jgi:hypothetical protein